MGQLGKDLEGDLQLLDQKLKQLKNEYDQYFLGSRQREPVLLRGELTKIINYFNNVRIQNTGLRFKFNNLRARFFTFRRLWDETLRKIEEGRYERHVFRAKLREREQPAATRKSAPDPKDLFDSYVSALEACGQGAKGVTREKLDSLVAKQTAAIQNRYGNCDVRFRVVVEDGKARLKAKAVRR